jgi:hypothetical protein
LPLIARLRDVLQLRFTAVFAALPPAVLASISPANPLKRLARVLGYAGLRLVGNVFGPSATPIAYTEPCGSTW